MNVLRGISRLATVAAITLAGQAVAQTNAPLTIHIARWTNAGPSKAILWVSGGDSNRLCQIESSGDGVIWNDFARSNYRDFYFVGVDRYYRARQPATGEE